MQRERELVLRLLANRIGALSKSAQAGIARLSIEQVENLALALLDFKKPGDLTHWLQEYAATNGKTNGHRAKKETG